MPKQNSVASSITSFKELGVTSAPTILLMAEILHKLIGSLSHYLQDFIYPSGCLGFLPSTVGTRKKTWLIRPDELEMPEK